MRKFMPRTINSPEELIILYSSAIAYPSRMKRPSHAASNVCHDPSADFSFASHRHLPIRKANRESAAGAFGFILPNSSANCVMELSFGGWPTSQLSIRLDGA